MVVTSPRAHAWAGAHERPATEPARATRGLRRLAYRELGATGIPVADDAPAELGISLAISSGAARHLIAEAIDLVHRLPAPGTPSSDQTGTHPVDTTATGAPPKTVVIELWRTPVRFHVAPDFQPSFSTGRN